MAGNEQSLVRHGLRVQGARKIFSLTTGRSGERTTPVRGESRWPSFPGIALLAVNAAGFQGDSCLYHSCRALTRGT